MSMHCVALTPSRVSGPDRSKHFGPRRTPYRDHSPKGYGDRGEEMTGWGLVAVLSGMFGICSFVSYWWAVGITERRSAGEIRLLRQQLIRKAAEAEVLEVNRREQPHLSAEEIFAWYSIMDDLEDEVA